ncbi:ATP-binding protein [Thetidibacter halocola]|uniref:ATP-binding protein n=1 Tax=Thetidibacter halocola TaxID=2827239 RepID=A0A8J8BAF2_9RHOB|nr:ATP-binding protein [Thetidibacter halocola]MBS0125133.1 ATP-binding protein [Thetidibacter halocola]
MTSDPTDPGSTSLTLVAEATLSGNRAVLLDLRRHLAKAGHPAARGGAWELVIAEALNNIVEHAYAGRDDGMIRVDLRWSDTQMQADLVDDGTPMPGGTPPGDTDTLDRIRTETLPEGGFGWGLIHTLVSHLDYRREGGCNHLSLTIPLDPA